MAGVWVGQGNGREHIWWLGGEMLGDWKTEKTKMN